MKEKIWIRIVDIVTVVWLIAFITGLISPHEIIRSRCGLVTLYLLPIFVFDLFVLFKKEDDFKTFLRKRWFDVLLVIPYFRVFRILRFARVLKFLKILKIKKALNATRLVKKSKRTAIALKGSQG